MKFSMNEYRGDRSGLEERLAAVKRAVEQGLPERARALRTAADRLSEGHGSARADLKRLAHKLRGIVGTFGYERLSGLATELERIAANEGAQKGVSLAGQVAALAEEEASAGSREDAKPGPGDKAGHPRPAIPPPLQSAAVVTRETRARFASPAPAGRAVPAPSTEPSDKARPERDATSPPRVLVVDDEQSDRMLLQLTLSKLGGFEATVVGSPLQALELLGSERFDLVLADAMMPELDGMQFVRSARERSGAAGMPIVILSAASPDELGWDTEGKGPTAWLRKPFVPRELVEQLRRILEQ